MIFHTPDRSLKRLAACWKRAESFAHEGVIDYSHKLGPAWGNCKLFLDASDNTQDERVYDLVLLDWFAERIDEYAKTNMMKDDETLSAILHEWKSRMRFNPVLMRNAVVTA